MVRTTRRHVPLICTYALFLILCEILCKITKQNVTLCKFPVKLLTKSLIPDFNCYTVRKILYMDVASTSLFSVNAIQ